MTPPNPYYDSVYDALAADVAAAGGAKQVSGKLWGGMDPVSASGKLRSALNPEQPHKLCIEELVHVMRLARAEDAHATMNFLARELGYEVKPVEPQGALRAALANFESIATMFKDAMEQVEKAKRAAHE